MTDYVRKWLAGEEESEPIEETKKITIITNVIEHNGISSNVVSPSFDERSEWRLLVEVDQSYLRHALRKTGCVGCTGDPYIFDQYLVILDTYQGKQLFYQSVGQTWLVQRR